MGSPTTTPKASAKDAILFFDEGDSFLRSRRAASESGVCQRVGHLKARLARKSAAVPHRRFRSSASSSSRVKIDSGTASSRSRGMGLLLRSDNP
jgi:hypothetical protein